MVVLPAEVGFHVNGEVAHGSVRTYELKEKSGGGSIHLILVAGCGLRRHRDVRGNEVEAVRDAVHIGRNRTFYISTDTQGYLSATVDEKEAWSARVLEMTAVLLVHLPDNFAIARLLAVGLDNYRTSDDDKRVLCVCFWGRQATCGYQHAGQDFSVHRLISIGLVRNNWQARNVQTGGR